MTGNREISTCNLQIVTVIVSTNTKERFSINNDSIALVF